MLRQLQLQTSSTTLRHLISRRMQLLQSFHPFVSSLHKPHCMPQGSIGVLHTSLSPFAHVSDPRAIASSRTVSQGLRWNLLRQTRGTFGTFGSIVGSTGGAELHSVKPKRRGSTAAIETQADELPPYLRDLNDEQLAAVTAPLDPIRIYAGPGSGKTRVLTSRIAYLMDRHDVPHFNILAITFTNKAATEMKERLEAMSDNPGAWVRACTFHSICSQILRQGGGLSSLQHTPRNSSFVIYDEDDTLSLLIKVMREMYIEQGYIMNLRGQECKVQQRGKKKAATKEENDDDDDGSHEQGEEGGALKPKGEAVSLSNLARKIRRAISSLKSMVNTYNMRGHEVVDVWKAKDRQGDSSTKLISGISHWYNGDALAAYYDRYQEALDLHNAVDYDDLLNLAVALLKEDAKTLEKMRNRWRHVLVDEFQDSNTAQYDFVKILMEHQCTLFVVGDPDQSIYGWRGANSANMSSQLETDFPVLTTMRLHNNYRSTPQILEAAVGLFDPFRSHYVMGSSGLAPIKDAGLHPAVHWCETSYHEGPTVCGLLRRAVEYGNMRWRDCAVLCRLNSQISQLEQYLTMEGIPYVVIGARSFWDKKEIRDCMAYVRLAACPVDNAALARLINVPARGIGMKSLGHLEQWAKGKGMSLARALFGHLVDAPESASVGNGDGCVDEPSRIDDVPGSWEEVELAEDLARLKMNKRERNGLQKLQFIIMSMRKMAKNGNTSNALKIMIDQAEFRTYVNSLEKKSPGKRSLVELDHIEPRWTNVLRLLETMNEHYVGWQRQFDQQMPFYQEAHEVEGAGLGRDPLECLKSFVERTALLDSSTKAVAGTDGPTDAVQLMTLHAAKGLEFPTVIIPGMVNGVLPLREKDVDGFESYLEEVRLGYVGFTRAKDVLHLITYEINNEGRPTEPSDFLKGFPGHPEHPQRSARKYYVRKY